MSLPLAAMALLGRIAGVSGILGGVVGPPGDRAWRLAFVLGLPVGAWLFGRFTGGLDLAVTGSLPLLIGAGLLVGVGTRMGSGCTSGHGVCGLARWSPRSMVAVPTFMVSAAVTVWLVRHVL